MAAVRQRVGAIDFGTNSALLLIAERDHDGVLQRVVDQCEITRLGKGTDAEGRLDPAAVERTLATATKYGELLDRYAVERRAAVGTAALRDASNSQDFLGPVAKLIGCDVEVISGHREAALTKRGVTTSSDVPVDGTLIFDVGGGSTEFVAADGDFSCSLQIGAVRFTERYLAGDPPTVASLNALRQGVREALAELVLPSPVKTLVGVAGTVTTLAAIELELDDYDGDRVDGLRLTKEQAEGLVARLGALRLAERKRLKGLDPKRADVIVAGSMIVAETIAHCAAGSLVASDRGVRWGLADALALGR